MRFGNHRVSGYSGPQRLILGRWGDQSGSKQVVYEGTF